MTNLNNKGLSSLEARKKLQEFGLNRLFTPAKVSFFSIARHEVTEPMILLLLVVGIFYSVWGKLEDAITIFSVIALLVFAEVFNEFRAKKAISSLEKIAAPKTRVFRDSIITEIDSAEVVPGDILILVSGTKLAADAVVASSVGIEVDESMLTGESVAVQKNPGDKLFAGTIVVSGEGEAKVVETGKNTRLGQISAGLAQVRPPRTALQLAMKSLAGKLVYLAVFFSVLIPVFGILRGQNIKTMILTGLSLSFATIPEELPIIITMVLGLGAYTLSRNKFLVKKLKAAETLGNATVIVTDKTGTITESRMRIVKIFPNREQAVIADALCTLSQYSASPVETEIAHMAAMLKLSADVPATLKQRNLGAGKKTKSIIRKAADGFWLYSSGAPEEIFNMCRDISPSAKEELSAETAKGRRVIAFAKKKLSSEQANLSFDNLEQGMEFSGIISFEDPPRAGVKDTIAKAAFAGIRTIMVTGDHPETARFIAKEVGITKDDKVLTGLELDKLSDEELSGAVRTVSVFARTTPEHKYRIVKALQKNGEVVAVTGDGINDSLALKGADIGIAMGIKGTDVAKEAAEIVLADDNFNTIAQGIFEGRKFFDNLQKGIKYYLSVKAALIMIFLLPIFLGIPMPLAPIHIIILELFMDLAASAGFVAEPAEQNIFSRPPHDPKENIFNNRVIANILFKGGFLFAAVTAVYLAAHYSGLGLKASQTLAFTAWIFGHIALAFVSRSDKESVFSMGVFGNKVINLWAVSAISLLVLGIYLPFLKDKINLYSVSVFQLVAAAVASVCVIYLLEIRKAFFLRRV